MTDFLPHSNARAVGPDGRFTRETYDALRRTVAALNDADLALSERQREVLAILNALGADDVESLEALGPLLEGKQDASAILDAVAAMTGFGLAVRTSGSWVGRSVTPVANETTVTNGNGITGNPTVGLSDLADSGAGALLAITRDAKGRVSGSKAATVTGTAGRITVANGDAAAGLPTVDLATVTDAGGGTLLRIVRDAWGRITGTSAPTTTDLAEGTNLYHTTARARAAAVADSITDGVLDVAPSQNAVFDALALKADDSAVVHNTGNETIAGNKTFTGAPLIDGAAGTFRVFGFRTSGSNRWQFTANNTAESGGNTGSDFTLTAFTDAGANNGNALTVTRATKHITPGTNNTQNFGSDALRWAASHTVNLAVGAQTASFGGGAGVSFLSNATTVPTGNPTAGALLYCQAGATKVRGSSGTITTIAPA